MPRAMYRLGHVRSLAALVAFLALTLVAAPAELFAEGDAKAAPAPAKPAAQDSTAAPSAGASDAKTAKKVLFKGVVQDDKLQPLAGATVTIVVIPESDDENAREAGMGMRFGGGRMAVRRGMARAGRRDQKSSFFSAKSDAQGAFTVAAEGSGTYNLRVDAAGFAPTIVEKVRPGDGVSTLFLKKGVSATGIVADLASGAPVPDAEVLAVAEDRKGFRDPDDPKRFAASAHTGRDGSFTVTNLDPSFYGFRVTAGARALYEANSKPVGDGPPAPLVFYLEPGFDVTGRVLDPAGKPASSADVFVSAQRRGASMLRFATRSGFAIPSAVTDKDGKFTLRGVPLAGKFTIEAGAKDFAPASAELPASRAGATVSGMELRLEKGVLLKGKFVDSEQKPVSPEVQVTLTYRDPKTRHVLRVLNRSGKDVHVSPAGELSIDRLPTGTATVDLSLEGFKDVNRKDVAIGKDSKTADLGTIVLDRGKKIAGKVVDADGKPVAKARVSGSSFSPGKPFGSAETKSDKDGKFTLGGLDPEGEWTVEATAKGYSSAKAEDVKPEGEPLELKLARAGSIKGRVVFGDPPRPISNYSLEASPKEEGGGGMAGMFRMMRGGRGDASRQSDPGGHFTLEDLTPGSYTIVVKAEGLLDLSRTGVDVRAGEATDLGDVALVAGGTVRGRVQSMPEGLPVPGAIVRVKAGGLFDIRNMTGGGEGTVLTDLAGRFEMKGLPAGTITLQVEPSNFAKKEVPNITVDPASPGDDVVVNVGKGGRIEGTVLGDDGRPKANAMVSAMSGMADFSARSSAVTDEQGHYTIDYVAAGTYNVSNLSMVMGDDEEEDSPTAGRRFGGLDSVSTEVKDGQTSTVNFGEKKIKVSGQVKRKQGETSGLIVVFTAMSSAGGPISAKIGPTDQNGRYEVTLQAPGEYNVAVGDQGMRGGSTLKVTVPDTPTFNYDVQIPEGGISGRVTDESGTPLSGVMVLAQAKLAKDEKASLMGRQGSRTTSAEDGTYSLSGLVPGVYDLSYIKEGFGAELRHGVELKGSDDLSGTDQTLSKGISFKVRVTNPSGAGVAGVIVMVAQDGELLGGVAGMTTEDGTVDMKALKPGIYSFIAITRDYAPGLSRDVSVGGENDADTALVRLQTGGTARVLVQDGGKQPISGVKIAIENLDAPEMSSAMELTSMMRGRASVTGADGVLPFERLPAGKYSVTVSKGDKTSTKSLTVEDGAQAELTVKLE